jgi:hypothetical protein
LYIRRIKKLSGIKVEWIGSFTGQDIANLVPRPTQPEYSVFARQDLPNLPPAPPTFSPALVIQVQLFLASTQGLSGDP